MGTGFFSKLTGQKTGNLKSCLLQFKLCMEERSYYMTNRQELNIAIIGCGVICPEHIKAYRMIPGVQVHTLCDLVPEKAGKMAEQYQIPYVTTTAEDIWNSPEIDAVSICTDHFSHCQLAVAALNAGKHVLCEKPLSSCKENMDRMVEEGKKHPELVFSGVFQHRFNPLYRYVRDLLQSGRFGKVLNTVMVMECLRSREYYEADQWRGKWQTEGGSLLMNQAIHTLDIYQWLLGGVAEVCGKFDNLAHQGIIETEDTAVAVLRFRNGALGTVSSSSASQLGWERIIQIFGTESTLELRNAQLVNFSSNNAELQEQVCREINELKQVQIANQEKSYYGIGHPAQIADFVEAIRQKRRPYVTAEDARDAVVLAQKILGRCC